MTGESGRTGLQSRWGIGRGAKNILFPGDGDMMRFAASVFGMRRVALAALERAYDEAHPVSLAVRA